jgi:uridine kinase
VSVGSRPATGVRSGSGPAMTLEQVEATASERIGASKRSSELDPAREATSAVTALAAQVRRLPPSVGTTRLIAVDGRSGSGKTTIGDRLAAELNAPILHLDELYEGWQGLPGVADLLHEWIARPLLEGRPARWRPYHWDDGTRGEWRTIKPSPVLVLEGCGAGSPPVRDHLALLIWVEVADDVREERLRARPDWDDYLKHYRSWADAESELLQRDHTPGHADVVVHNDHLPASLILKTPPPT